MDDDDTRFQHRQAYVLANTHLTGETLAHARRVAHSLVRHGDLARAAGWLHDAFEDTDLTADDLRSAGIGEGVIEAVARLTRDEEPYGVYISDLAPHPLARIVKIADLQDNLSLPRMAALAEGNPGRAARLTARYTEALALLMRREFGPPL